MFRRYVHKSFPVLIGLGVSAGLFAFYLGLMTFTGDWDYATVQFEEYRWWIVALSAGLGVQSSLFTLLRRGLKGKAKKTATSTLAASGGLSAGSMAVCCLHHLTDVVPFLGLPVLAVTLQKYQTAFFLAGVLSNFYGILMMLHVMQKHGLIQRSVLPSFSFLKLRVVMKKGDYKDERAL